MQRRVADALRQVERAERRAAELLAPTDASTLEEHEAERERLDAAEAARRATKLSAVDRFERALANAERAQRSESVKRTTAALKSVVLRGTPLLREVRALELQCGELRATTRRLAAQTRALQEEVLERYAELEHVKSPLLAENVFAYGYDSIPTAASRFSQLVMPPPPRLDVVQSSLTTPTSAWATETVSNALLPQVVMSAAAARKRAGGAAAAARPVAKRARAAPRKKSAVAPHE